MVADRPHLKVVLAVDIHGRASADGRIHGSRHYKRPPAVLDGVLPYLLNGDARLAADDAGIRIPVRNAVHAGQVQAYLFGGRGRVPIAAPSSSKTYLQAPFSGKLENLVDSLR